MRKGFTFIELLVVLVIISISAAFVGPRIAGSMSNMNLKTASRKIAATLRYARSQAVSESRTYAAFFDLDKNRVTIKGGVTSGNGEDENDGIARNQKNRLLKSYTLPDDVRLDKGVSGEQEIDSGFFQIIFLANGASSGGGVFLRNDRGNQYVVTVDFVTGTVRLERDET